MATIDQQFVEYIVKTLVNNPDKVEVERRIDEKGVLLSLTVDPDDVGRVIGRHGVTAQAMRVLLRALGTKQDARYNLKIENGGGAGRGEAAYAAAETEVTEPNGDTETEEMAVASDEAGDSVEEVEESEEASDTSELAEKTRAELADLDDLDI